MNSKVKERGRFRLEAWILGGVGCGERWDVEGGNACLWSGGELWLRRRGDVS